MASVQFYGSDNALTAYENNRVPAWGLFSGRQLLFKYTGQDIEEGAALLDEVLRMIEHSNATYTLKVFEPDKNGEVKIKENTPCDGSFNFKLVDENTYEERKQQRFGNNNNLIESKLAAIEAKLESLESEPEDEPDESGSVLDRVGAIFLNEPEKISVMIGAIQSIVSMFTNQTQYTGQQPQPVAAINGVPDSDNKPDEQINAAIEILLKHDSKLPEHLVKLAMIAENDPATWKMLIGMIDKF